MSQLETQMYQVLPAALQELAANQCARANFQPATRRGHLLIATLPCAQGEPRPHLGVVREHVPHSGRGPSAGLCSGTELPQGRAAHRHAAHVQRGRRPGTDGRAADRRARGRGRHGAPTSPTTHPRVEARPRPTSATPPATPPASHTPLPHASHAPHPRRRRSGWSRTASRTRRSSWGAAPCRCR